MADDPVVGKAKGGVARAASLTPEKRKEISQKALQAKADAALLPRVTHGSADHPLKIGDIEIPCYVIEGERRVLSLTGLVGGLGMKFGSGAGSGADRLTAFTGGKGISPFISDDLSDLITNPIKFRTPNGNLAYGYDAQILAELCDAVLAARKAKALQKQQLHIAVRCETLMRGFARVGIIALVDETTGYQKDRAKDSLAKILEAFIAKELRPWVLTFENDYYQELFRLRGLSFPTDSVQKPQYFGILTNDIVYKRLAPGVLEELKKVVEKNAKGRPKNKLFQRLTENIGYKKLREHLIKVTTIMQLSVDYKDFILKLDRLHPRYDRNMLLPFMEEYEASRDSGKGL